MRQPQTIETPSYNSHAVGIWLYTLFLLVFIMVLIGGLTRLTDSGLSITDWSPVKGMFPPMSYLEWLSLFNKYKETSEFIVQNNTMTLEEFKYIFWWEWGHRQFGRLIGATWLIGIIWLSFITRIPRSLMKLFMVLGLLGSLQAVIGWWMVKSGLSEEKTMLDVASYRLAIHLSLALIILSVIYALININRSWNVSPKVKVDPKIKNSQETLTNIMLGLFFLQVFLGALVSGIDAGLSYSDWPFMNGRVIPEDIFYLNPWRLNFLENPALVQFNHRLMGYCIFVFGFVLWVRGITLGISNRKQIIKSPSLFSVLSLQVILGILAVLMSVPLILGLAHQLVAMILLLCILNLKFSLSAERQIKVVYG